MRRDWLKLPLPIIILVQLLSIDGQCESLPQELNLSRTDAIKMAITGNIEVHNESLSSFMAELDSIRSRSIYNPLLTLSANSGINASPGEPFRTRNTQTTIGLSQNLPTGGSISVTTQTGYATAESEDPELTSRNWQTSLGLNLSQPLLRNAGRETNEFSIFAADSNLQDAVERFRSIIIDTVHAVVTSYNRLYTLRRILETRKAALASAEMLLEGVRQKVTPETPLAMEVADADFAVVQRRKELVEAERNVRDHEAGFRYLIGQEGKATIIPVDPPSREEPQETEEQAVVAALGLRPELLQLQISYNVAQVQERIARRQAWPELSLTGSGGLNGTGETMSKNWKEIIDGRRRFWTVGMQFSYPIGNTAAVNDYRRSKIRTEQLLNQIRSLSWRIRNEVESDMRALISARLQVRMADMSLRIAEKRLEEYRRNNQAGTSTVQDVIDAQNDLTFARNSQVDAVETFASAVSRLWRDMGTLLDHHGIKIDAEHVGKIAGKTALKEESKPEGLGLQLPDLEWAMEAFRAK
ncbi:efflux pump, RND family, outer membrane protein [Geotalea daltonii FRC-32]|uniref:Efflux pump, RND family, outer membrane protein n=1 Tax=Geotalea daltonii (strain DSM 22248 / JCM 15807 / FRC-32) TaxID=316067 RepID=B9M9C8_GEODF|nr:TolC family protein [Geotalea daltonii]ACM18686.1 efflux pump, RND family, outer membrane protein [Geotalea daltonii FRC-32]